MNTIVPISELSTASALDGAKKEAAAPESSAAQVPFASLFQDAVGNVSQTGANLNNEIYKMTTGQSDNLHDITIASQKYSLSVDLLVQMRNKVLDAYNEVMRMSV